jgi:ABC-type bacteriocin/lantibiotic exporter with double-glycine peptidase domain
MFKRARAISSDILQFNVQSNKILFEAIQTYREIYVRNRRTHYIDEIVNLKRGIATAQAEQAFLPNVSKYVVEITLIVGAILLSAILFISQDASHAFAGLALFLASGSRIGPSLLRLQQSLIQIQSSFIGAIPAISMMKKIISSPTQHGTISAVRTEEFVPMVEVEAVTFRYPDADSDAIRNISLRVKQGSSLALVGPSGGGKSTLIDLILGIQDPTKGKILVSGLPPSQAVANWPGRMAYVPQDVRMIDLSIRENIALGFSKNEIDEVKVQESLRIAKLEEFVRSLPLGLDTGVGEFGAKISGGQRQRLGIARALYTSPKLLVLDEATSALDGQTEVEVSEAIRSLKNKVTLILVAHRLSTVRDADIVAYLEGGSVIAVGTFEEVRSKVPNFDLQADLMGL